MPNQRTQIIIKEINYWKKNKLLPAVYCDFLLALYTEGESEQEVNTHHSRELSPLFQLMIQIILLLLSIIIINFEEVSMTLMVPFLGISLLIIIWVFKKQTKQKQIYFYLSTTILLVFILLVSVYMSNLYANNQWITNSIVWLNFIGWFLIARKFRLKYLLVISVFACILSLFMLF